MRGHDFFGKLAARTECAPYLLYGWTIVFLALAGSPVFSQTNSGETNEIMRLHPPRAEIPPTFWEQNGQWIAMGGAAALFGLAVTLYFWTRPRPPLIPPPEVTARKQLAALEGKTEDGAVLSAVSQIIRRYVMAAFGLAPVELTTTEFCKAVEAHPQVGPELSGALGEFLRRCDERKFSETPVGPELKAVARGAELVSMAEARRAELRAAAAAAAAAATQSTAQAQSKA